MIDFEKLSRAQRRLFRYLKTDTLATPTGLTASVGDRLNATGGLLAVIFVGLGADAACVAMAYYYGVHAYSILLLTLVDLVVVGFAQLIVGYINNKYMAAEAAVDKATGKPLVQRAKLGLTIYYLVKALLLVLAGAKCLIIANLYGEVDGVVLVMMLLNLLAAVVHWNVTGNVLAKIAIQTKIVADQYLSGFSLKASDTDKNDCSVTLINSQGIRPVDAGSHTISLENDTANLIRKGTLTDELILSLVDSQPSYEAKLAVEKAAATARYGQQ